MHKCITKSNVLQYLSPEIFTFCKEIVAKVSEQTEQGIRLERLIESLGLTQTTLSELVNISQGYVSLMVSGRRNISRSVLQGITKKFPQVDVRWLMTGEGDMFLPEKADSEKTISVVKEPTIPYVKQGGVVDDLVALLADYGRRISVLEAEVARLKKKE